MYVVARHALACLQVGHAEERNVSGTPGELEPTTVAGVSFPNDIRGTSGLGVGDGLNDHTEKWKSVSGVSAKQALISKRTLTVERERACVCVCVCVCVCGRLVFDWQLPGKSPMDYVNVLEPIKVYTNVVTCTGDSTPGLGSPVGTAGEG